MRPAQPGGHTSARLRLYRDGGQLLAQCGQGILNLFGATAELQSGKKAGLFPRRQRTRHTVEQQDGRRNGRVLGLQRGGECEVEIGAAFVQTHDVRPQRWVKAETVVVRSHCTRRLH